MKALLICTSLLLVGFCGIAQSKGTAKLYGYQQAVSGGKSPEVNADGLKTSEGQGKNYFIYAASTGRIYTAEIWLDGVRFNTTNKTIKQTPVEYSDEQNMGAAKKTLVPKTTKTVIKVDPTPFVKETVKGTKAKTLAQTNAVVLVYKQAGKFYYATLKELLDLEGAAMN